MTLRVFFRKFKNYLQIWLFKKTNIYFRRNLNSLIIWHFESNELFTFSVPIVYKKNKMEHFRPNYLF